MNPDDAKALLSSTQQLRTHWSGVITSHLSLSLTINVAIWSYFAKSYIDSIASYAGPTTIFIYLASALSSVLLGLWRIYTRHIDDHIANLYPDFLLCEGILQVPFDRGTSGYLMKAVPGLDRLLGQQTIVEERVGAIATLVKSKRAGDRGHLKIDLFALTAILLMSLCSFLMMNQSNSQNDFLFLIGNALGFIFMIVSINSFQRNPCENQVDNLLKIQQEKEGREDKTTEQANSADAE